ELAAGVQRAEDELERVLLVLGDVVDGDAAAVVLDGDAATVGVQRHPDGLGEAVDHLVDGVVDDLPQQVVEATVVDATDVHTGSLADRLEAFEDRDVLAGVFALSHYSFVSALSAGAASCGTEGGGNTTRATFSLRENTCLPLPPRGPRSFLSGRTSSVLPLSLS